jgi:hypothetical protein
MPNDTNNALLLPWQSEPDGRSSFDILWSSLVTLFACTWTVLHLNIPKKGLSQWKIGLRKVRWLLITAIAPELVTAYAFGEFLQARSLLESMRSCGIATADWDLSHGFYFNMGALNLETKDGYEIPVCRKHYCGDGWTERICNEDVITLRLMDLIKYPEVSKQEIQDRSKGDTFVKIFALLQSAWFVFSAVSRAIAKLPVSPIELSCCAYVFCTCITYAFWWHKPKDIMLVNSKSCHFDFTDLPLDLQKTIKSIHDAPSDQRHYRWRNFPLTDTEIDVLTVVRRRMPALMGLAVGVIFCCFHILAWNDAFPSRFELMLWRAASIAASSIPVIGAAFPFIRGLSPKVFDSLWPLVRSIYLILGVTYVSSRIVLIVMLFTTLRALPAGAYATVSWTKAIPHV